MATDQSPVLVLGATGDLGSAVARRLHSLGVPTILHAYENATNLAYLAEETGALTTVLGDLSDDHGLTSLSEALEGFDSLSSLINCIGINPSADTLADTSPDDWDAILSVNLRSAWRTASLALPRLRAGEGGSVVLVGSVFGVRTPARRGAYGASKHAIIGLAQAIAQEEEGLVRANAVAPGPMWGENVRRVFQEHASKAGITIDEYVASRAARIPGHRFVTVEECAAVCVFLASSESSGINGQCVVVDGGEF